MRNTGLSSPLAGIFSLTLVSVKLLLEAGLGVLDCQQCDEWSLERFTADSADCDRRSTSQMFY